MRLSRCHNTGDFRRLARKRLPKPVFDYIDGGADDETTLSRNTEAFNQVDLVPQVLRGINQVDLSTSVLGSRLKLPIFFSPTAMQRLFHIDGERAIAHAAVEFGTLFCLSTIGTRSIEEMGQYDAPKLFQMYVHNDPGLTNDLVDRCRAANFDALALTVDAIVAGNRERDFYSGFTTPPKLTLASLASFALHPSWSLNYLFGERFELPNVSRYISAGSSVSTSVAQYIHEQMKPSISWDEAARMIERWQGPFAIKGVMSVDDARRAVDIGASAIMISNHGGRQLDGARSPFDQLSAIADAVGGEIELILDGGIRRGTHVLKALAAGANACSGGRFYLFPLAAGGVRGVRLAMKLFREELERDMMLLGCTNLCELGPAHLAAR